MKSGMISNGEKVTLQVNEEARKNTEKNHSATHLLQKALKTVLGAHVEQKGSLVTPTRLRFDFAHFQAMTPEELEKVENLVNEKIQEQIPVVTDIMDTEEAKKSGAMALFGEKYGDKVRVVSMGDFSKELCGGTHVKNTAEIGLFKLVSEAGVAAGVRRIEALTGPSVTAYYKAQEEKMHEAAALLKTTPADLLEKIAHLQAEAKALQAENESLKSKLAKEALGDVMDKVTEVKGVKLLAASVPDVDMNGLRDLGDQLKEKLGSGVVVLASAKDGKVSLLAMVTDDAMKKGAHAGKLIKEVAAVVGGGGGGRPNMAQAGGKESGEDRRSSCKSCRGTGRPDRITISRKNSTKSCRLQGRKRSQAGGREKFCKKMKKLVDVRDFSGIIRTVQKIPIQLYYAQSTTGGRLGVRLCQM